jgi:hypothetical protein
MTPFAPNDYAADRTFSSLRRTVGKPRCADQDVRISMRRSRSAPDAEVKFAAGARIAIHDCRPLQFVATARPQLDLVGDLVVVENLGASDSQPAVCGFRMDGSGPTLKHSLGIPPFLGAAAFVFHGWAYVDSSGGRVRLLDSRLMPVGPILEDPRPSGEAIQRCHVTGEYPIRDDVVAGIRIIASGWCCGGGPGGLFLCGQEDAGDP